MNRQLASRNAMVDWQVAPTEYESKNYDEPKFRYRKYVEDMIHPLSQGKTRKKTFVTISTNVLCADIQSKKPEIDPIDRDIYLPLEIALTKWSHSEACLSRRERTFTTKTWIINPGQPTSNCFALDHKKNHKIEYSLFRPQDIFIEKDLNKVYKEINAFLTPDRTVFSRELRHCRQDLGCLKWLNREIGYKMKPIKVLSLEDLYIVILRHLSNTPNEEQEHICQGVARLHFGAGTNTYCTDDQCDYHRDRNNEDDAEECGNCAKAIAIGYSHVILDDSHTLFPESDKQPIEHSTSSAQPADDVSALMSDLKIGEKSSIGH